MMTCRKTLSFVVAILFAFQSAAFAQNKPSLIVSPLRGKNTKPAMDAIANEFRKSNQVYVIDFEKVMEYAGKNQKREKKSTADAVTAFEAGKKSYQNLNIKESIASLEKSKALYMDALWDESSFEGLRTTKFYLAMAYLADKKEAQAKSELQEMILIDPKRGQTKPSEKYYSPQIRQLYREVLAEIQSAEKGDLHIQTTPANATVFLDGVAQGVTPFDVQDIPIGKHYIRLVPAGTTQGEMITKSIVEGKNEIEYTFPEVASGDNYAFFQTLGAQKELDQTRASYLDEMGLALGADLFVFLTPLQGKVRGQLYDQRSQELSREVTEPNPQALVSKLLQSLGPDGYVVAGDSNQPADESVSAHSSGIELKPRSSDSMPHDKGIDYTQPPATTPKTIVPWYQNKWVWMGIGAAVIGGAATAYFLGAFDSGSSASTVKANIP